VPRAIFDREGMRFNSAERRRSPRIRLQIPMFVRGVDAQGSEFLELTKTLDVSATGAFLASPRRLSPDHIVHLTIPAPPPTSSGRVPAETPPILARVRRQVEAGDVHLIGVEFLRPLD
jgi:PilZ domain